jgi:hypothetical protein
MFRFALISLFDSCQWLYFWQWKPEVWSAIGTVVSAVTVVFLARYTIKSTSVLEQQARDSAIQAKVSVGMLRRLEQDAEEEKQRRYMVAAIRLQDVRHDVIKRRNTLDNGELPKTVPILPPDWSAVLATILECRPELVEHLSDFDIKCRPLEQLLQALSQPGPENARSNKDLMAAFRAIEPAVDALGLPGRF